MKIPKLILILVLYFLTNNISVLAQNQQFDEIRGSDDYIWGFGQSEDYEKAGKLALDDMIGKISVHVESHFQIVSEEKNFDFKEYTKSVIKTYSSVSLTNTNQLDCEKRGTFYTLKYIEADDLKEIFDFRENKISDYLEMGTKAQRENYIGDALRYYYWSYALWLSHPYRDKIEINVDGKQYLQVYCSKAG